MSLWCRKNFTCMFTHLLDLLQKHAQKKLSDLLVYNFYKSVIFLSSKKVNQIASETYSNNVD